VKRKDRLNLEPVVHLFRLVGQTGNELSMNQTEVPMQTIDSTVDTVFSRYARAFMKALNTGGGKLSKDVVPQFERAALNLESLPTTKPGTALAVRRFEPKTARKVGSAWHGPTFFPRTVSPRLPSSGASQKLNRSVLGAVATDVAMAIGEAALQHRETTRGSNWSWRCGKQ